MKLEEALAFAVGKIEGDPEPLNDRERADGNLYVVRMLSAVLAGCALQLDPDRPSFLPMLEPVRYVGGSGPDIDYDVAAVRPDSMYTVSGVRGDATFVGITVYAGAGVDGASAVVASVDVDDVLNPDGTFSWNFSHPEAARVIVRQYFHDRRTQSRGSWSIDRVDTGAAGSGAPTQRLMGTVEMHHRIVNAANSLRWNARLNELWTPERRMRPNEFVRQSADEIVAAIPNPDVVYSTAWWKIDDADDVAVIDFVPPATNYWGLQLVDRWFQCFPDRRSNLNDRQCVPNPDGSVTIVLSDGDPGVPNWLDTSGHRTGVAFFRWLHADIVNQPTCRIVSKANVSGPV